MVFDDILGNRVICNESTSSRSDTTGGILNLNTRELSSLLRNFTTRDKQLIARRGVINTKPGASHFDNVYSTPEASGSTTGHNVSLSQQLSGIKPTYNSPIGYVVPYVDQERKSSPLAMQSSTPSPTQTSENMDISMSESGDRGKENKVERKDFKLISTLYDLFPKDKSILQCTKCYSFHIREKFNFRSTEIEKYCEEGKYDKIIELSDSCLSSYYNKTRFIPGSVVFTAYYNKGEALCAQGKHDEALQVFKKVFDMKEIEKVHLGQASIARSMAKVYCEKREYDKAIDSLKEVDDEDVNELISNDIKVIEEYLKLYGSTVPDSNLCNISIDPVRTRRTYRS